MAVEAVQGNPGRLTTTLEDGMSGENGKKRRGRIPFAERLAELDEQIKGAEDRVRDLVGRREAMVTAEQERVRELAAAAGLEVKS